MDTQNHNHIKQDDFAVNTAKKQRGRPFKKGHDARRNTSGRPRGSKNLTTLVMETLRNKRYKIKSPVTGEIEEIDGLQAFAEAVLENAIKKKDRESLRMIWEYADGKPQQKTDLSVGGPKGYEVDPETERRYLEQFGFVNRYEPIEEK